MIPEIHELRQARLEDDLTYRQLADRLDLGLSSIHGILNAPRPRVNDRTLYRIRKFLEARKGRAQRASA